MDNEVHEHVHADGTVHIHHGHAHSHTQTKVVLNRLSRAIGHLNAVKRMVEQGRDCSDVLIQLSAVNSALQNVSKIILKDHIEHCLVEAVKEDDREAIDKLKEAIDKFIK
ncbi:MAG TPA: metal-sensing transcriptional repressor [Candidatus Megamonas gallistercoris]|nr:metal-sensing transcriptional repressor [Candidatus Megamonas gallistercoris]